MTRTWAEPFQMVGGHFFTVVKFWCYTVLQFIRKISPRQRQGNFTQIQKCVVIQQWPRPLPSRARRIIEFKRLLEKCSCPVLVLTSKALTRLTLQQTPNVAGYAAALLRVFIGPRKPAVLARNIVGIPALGLWLP